MPILNTTFKPTIPFTNGHFNTVYRYLFVKEDSNYNRVRIPTWDNDFIDLDFSTKNSFSLIVLIHGLEGSSQSSYMISTAKYLNNLGYDTVCVNLRGCSGEDNNLLQTYHSGKTDDIAFIIDYIKKQYTYKNIILCGFSVGGNLALKYLGEYVNTIPSEVKGGIGVSVPIDLNSSQIELSKFKNKMYIHEFLKSLKLKILHKADKFPDFKLDKKRLLKATKFRHIEELYTVPIFNFDSPEDYYTKASSKPYLNAIKLPTLLVNATDDSFLSEECFPYDLAKDSTNFHLVTPKYGGHVGFMTSFGKQNLWLEYQVASFIQQQLNIHS